MIDQNDAGIVERCLRGESAAFESLVEKYQKAVYNLALRMTRDADEAEDIAQAAFVKAYEKLRSYDPRYKFFSWLYRIVLNEALNVFRQRRTRERLDETLLAAEEDGGEEEEEAGRRRALEESLMELRFEYRVVVVLKHLQNLSYADIGQVLDIPEKKVKSRLFAARHLLRDILTKRGLTRNG